MGDHFEDILQKYLFSSLYMDITIIYQEWFYILWIPESIARFLYVETVQ